MKIIAYYETPMLNSYTEWEVEIDDEDLEDLSSVERERLIDEVVQQEFNERVWSGWREA